MKEEARRKRCTVRISLIRKNKTFQKSYMKIAVRKLLTTGLVLARASRGQAVGIAPTESFKLRRQVAAAAGKEESVSLSLFLDVNDFELRQLGQKELGLENGPQSRKKRGESRSLRGAVM